MEKVLILISWDQSFALELIMNPTCLLKDEALKDSTTNEAV